MPGPALEQRASAQSGSLQSGSLRSGSLRSGSLQSGSLRSGSLRSGSLQSGSRQRAQEPPQPWRRRARQAPSLRLSSSQPSSWPQACQPAAAWPPEVAERLGPRPWKRRTSRTRRDPAVWRVLPCWLPRAPSRAHGPEPSTQLSCLGPGRVRRTVSASDTRSCSRAHGVFILELPVRSSGVGRRSRARQADAWRGAAVIPLDTRLPSRNRDLSPLTDQLPQEGQIQRSLHSQRPFQAPGPLSAAEALGVQVQMRPSPRQSTRWIGTC